MGEPLATRRDLLSREVLPRLADSVRDAPRFDAALPDLIAAVRAQGLEGLVAKRLDSVYEPGARSGAWRKMRLNRSEEFVIGGYIPASSRRRSSAVLHPADRGPQRSLEDSIMFPFCSPLMIRCSRWPFANAA